MKNSRIPKQIYKTQQRIIRGLERLLNISLVNSEKSMIRQFLIQIKSGRGRNYRFNDIDCFDAMGMFFLQYIDHCDLVFDEDMNSNWIRDYSKGNHGSIEKWVEYIRMSRELYLLP